MTSEDQTVFQCLINTLWGMAKGVEVEAERRGCVFVRAMVADVLDKCVAMDRRLALEPIQEFPGQPGANCGNAAPVVGSLSGHGSREGAERLRVGGSAASDHPTLRK